MYAAAPAFRHLVTGSAAESSIPVPKKAYVAVDVAADGRMTLDTFRAPHDTAAKRRALSVAEGIVLALWREGELVGHWRRVGQGRFQPAPADPAPSPTTSAKDAAPR